jgi:hypothetical protein
MPVDFQRKWAARQEMKGPMALVMGWALVVLVVVAPEWGRAEVAVLEHPQEDKGAQDNQAALLHNNH